MFPDFRTEELGILRCLLDLFVLLDDLKSPHVRYYMVFARFLSCFFVLLEDLKSTLTYYIIIFEVILSMIMFISLTTGIKYNTLILHSSKPEFLKVAINAITHLCKMSENPCKIWTIEGQTGKPYTKFMFLSLFDKLFMVHCIS